METFDTSAGRDAGLWAITSYFNPMRYQSKRANYIVFRKHLRVPLLAIELGYSSDFELQRNDAEILVQRRGQDILWQKERLLNIALQALPGNCRKVVWLDCDVIFEADDWAERTSRSLDRFPLVQPFSHLHRMPPYWMPSQPKPSEIELLCSVPFLIASGMPAATCLSTPFSRIQCTPGYAWAANREQLGNHILYDACIVGGGDSAMARAAYGRFEDALRLQYLHRDHYLSWAIPFHEAVRSNVGFLTGNLFHLWHGKTEYRQYRERNEQMERFQFDPFIDVALDQNGVWRWNSAKLEMHEFVREYFSRRREDGK
jgi:hypothetical protein